MTLELAGRRRRIPRALCFEVRSRAFPNLKTGKSSRTVPAAGSRAAADGRQPAGDLG